MICKFPRAPAPTVLANVVAIATLLSGCTQQSVAQSADTFKARILESACSGSANTDQATRDFAQQTCSAYLRGLTDGLFAHKQFAGSDCLPTDQPVSIAEATSELHIFLQEHPELADNSAGLVATAAIMGAHPCSVRQ